MNYATIKADKIYHECSTPTTAHVVMAQMLDSSTIKWEMEGQTIRYCPHCGKLLPTAFTLAPCPMNATT